MARDSLCTPSQESIDVQPHGTLHCNRCRLLTCATRTVYSELVEVLRDIISLESNPKAYLNDLSTTETRDYWDLREETC